MTAATMSILLSSRCNFTIIMNFTNAKRANYNFKAALQFELKIFLKFKDEFN